MKFQVLGGLVVSDGQDSLPIARGAQRVVIAALLLNANRMVAIGEIIDDLWDSPPATARASVHNSVMRLRRALGACGHRVVTHAVGYQISTRPGELDLASFEQAIGSARDAARRENWQLVSELLGAALELWRGEPFTDIPSARIAQREGPRLIELRNEAIEGRAEADINLGRYGQAIAELVRLTHAEPLREHAHALHMTALYRAGQRSGALAAYHCARMALLQEGLSPGSRLRELQRSILLDECAAIHAGGAWPKASR
jgi:DNA-binding SARP family transcriptional activator